MTTRKRRSLDDIGHVFQTYLFHRETASTATKEKEKAAKKLRDFTRNNGTVAVDDDGNEINGNIQYFLEDPVQVGGKIYRGMEMRKQPQISFDDEAAIALAEHKGILGEVSHRELHISEGTYLLILHLLRESGLDTQKAEVKDGSLVIDQDAFYVLNQQGKITDDELEGLLVEDEPKYSLWPIEGQEF